MNGHLFLPCAAGVEALLADEVAHAAAGSALHGCARRRRAHRRCRAGDAAEPGEPAGAACAVARRLKARTAASTTSTRWRAPCAGHDWITPKQTLRVDTTARNAPLKSLNFASLRIKDAVCDAMRETRRRAARRRHPRPRSVAGAAPGRQPGHAVCGHLGRAAVQARLARLARRRRAAEGDAGRRACWPPPAGAAAPKTVRCSTRAAAPAPSPSKRRRSPAASRTRAGAPLRLRAAGAVSRPPGALARRWWPPRALVCMRALCRCSPATCRFA